MTNPTDKPRASAVKQAQPKKQYQGEIVLTTGAFDVRKPILIEQAERLFREKVKDVNGPVTVDSVRLVKVNHHVGTSATYVFEAEYTPSLVAGQEG